MEVHFRPLRRPNVGFDVTHPRHDLHTRLACWICQKYSCWLEENFPETFQTWNSGQLRSSVRPSTQMSTPDKDAKQTSPPEKETWRIAILSMTLQPVDFPSQHELELGVRLLSTQG
jgi:hypothetical protein